MAAAVLMLGGIADARAGFVTAGTSQGYEVSADLTLTLLGGATVQATVPPEVPAQGTAPAPYNNTATAAALDLSAGAFGLGSGTTLHIHTGLLQSTAASDVDGLAGPRSTTASSLLDGTAGGAIVSLLNGLLDINASVIASNAAVGGSAGALTTGGSSTLTDLVISVLGVPVFAHAGAFVPTPNFTVDISSALGGVSIILDETLTSGNGSNAAGITVNAIDVRLTNVGLAGVGIVNGQIIIGHASAAEAAAVPEPSSLALCGIGGGLLGLRTLRRVRRGR